MRVGAEGQLYRFADSFTKANPPIPLFSPTTTFLPTNKTPGPLSFSSSSTQFHLSKIRRVRREECRNNALLETFAGKSNPAT